MILLKDKIALVTGAAQGIGRAIAEAYASHGAHVIVADINKNGTEDIVAKIKQNGGQATPATLDVADEQSVASTIAMVVNELGRLDILVNNAAVLEANYVIDCPLESWQRVFRVNVEGTFLCSKAAVKQMISQGNGGSIINISSASARKADLKHAAYSSSKAAVVAFTRILALEVGEYGIRVNALLPGATVTPMLENVFASVPGIREELIAKTTLGKLSQPEDQANVAVFLASNLAGHITGEYIVVSGGEFMNG